VFIGHFAAGLLAKRAAPGASLGTLVAAATLPDLLWVPLFVLGVEHVRIQPGITAVNALDLYDIPISHSLLMDAVWAVLLAGAYFLLRRYPRGALVVAAAVLSHWVLDFVSHRPDMPLAPGVHRYFGLGLWNSRAATFAVEGLLWAAALVVYTRATRPKTHAGVWAFWTVATLLTLLWLLSLGGAPPPGLTAIAVSNFVIFAGVLAWAYWIDRLRPAEVR
jgi:hypothetical protein